MGQLTISQVVVWILEARHGWKKLVCEVQV